MRLFNKGTTLWMLFSLLLVPPVVRGQEEKPEYTAPEIVVTATRTEKSVEDISATVSVITREDIEASNATSVMDILSTLPGLFVKKQERFGRADINIRGIGQRGRRIMVLIDGRPVKMGIFGCTVTHSLPLDNVERIEVVRGPASVLYGSDALGGVINIITKKAKKKFETDATVSYGSHKTEQALLRHGGSRGPFNYYLTADRKRSDGHRPNARYDSQDYTAKAGYTLTDKVEATILGKYFHGEKREPGPASNPTPDAWDDYERGAVDLTLTGKWEKADGSLKIYRNFGEHKFSDGFHCRDFTLGGSLRLSTRALPNNELTAGFDLRKQGGEQLAALPFCKKGEWDKTEYAPFVHNEHIFWGRLILSLGARLNRDSIYGSEFCPHAGLVYHLSEKTILRAAVNKAFRSPQINELYVFRPSHTDLEPERVWNYEVGVDQRLSRQLSADMVLYRLRGENLIEKRKNPNPPPMYKFQNSGEFEFTGAELSLTWRPGQGFSTLADYTYLDAGEKTAGRPKNKLDVTARYRWHKVSASLTGQYVAGLYAGDDHTDPLPDYFVAHAKLTYRAIANLSAFLAVDNLFDKEYQIEKDYPMPGRTFTVGITSEF